MGIHWSLCQKVRIRRLSRIVLFLKQNSIFEKHIYCCNIDPDFVFFLTFLFIQEHNTHNNHIKGVQSRWYMECSSNSNE